MMEVYNLIFLICRSYKNKIYPLLLQYTVIAH